MRARVLLLPLIAALAFAPAEAYTYKVIHDFCSKRFCKDGNQPQSGLVMDTAGNLYGTTFGTAGSSTYMGSVYVLVPDGSKWKLRTLHQFREEDHVEGAAPQAPLILDAAGNLYGTTIERGPDNDGTVFELLANGRFARRELKVLHSFDDADTHGTVPQSGLAYQGQASGAPYDGTSPLYGSAGGSAGGAVYQLTLNAGIWTHANIYNFCVNASCPDGKNPAGPLLVDGDGSIVGTTTDGGFTLLNKGTVYKLADTGSGWTETVLHGFCTPPDCRDGHRPFSGVIGDALGNLYGTAFGLHKDKDFGLIYKLGPDASYDILYKFCSLADCRDGASTYDAPVMDGSGTLFGVTRDGGGNNGDPGHQGGGTVYSFDGTTRQTLYRFCAKPGCRDGYQPVGRLTVDAGGNLFGVTSRGGQNDAGVVFELSP